MKVMPIFSPFIMGRYNIEKLSGTYIVLHAFIYIWKGFTVDVNNSGLLILKYIFSNEDIYD